MATKVNLYVDQGSTFTNNISLADKNVDTSNLAFCTIQAQVRKWYTSSNAINLVASIPDPTLKNATIALDANTSGNLDFGRFVYDVKFVDQNNIVTRIQEGIFTVNPEVTR